MLRKGLLNLFFSLSAEQFKCWRNLREWIVVAQKKGKVTSLFLKRGGFLIFKKEAESLEEGESLEKEE